MPKSIDIVIEIDKYGHGIDPDSDDDSERAVFRPPKA